MIPASGLLLRKTYETECVDTSAGIAGLDMCGIDTNGMKMRQ